MIARELTKLHETIVKASLGEVLDLVMHSEHMRKGEFVVIVDGVAVDKEAQVMTPEQEKVLRILLTECSIKSAVAMAVEITGLRKKVLYQAALVIDSAKKDRLICY